MDTHQLVKTGANPNIPEFGPGDSVKVNFRIREGERERDPGFSRSRDPAPERGRARRQLHGPADFRRYWN